MSRNRRPLTAKQQRYLLRHRGKKPMTVIAKEINKNIRYLYQFVNEKDLTALKPGPIVKERKNVPKRASPPVTFNPDRYKGEYSWII